MSPTVGNPVNSFGSNPSSFNPAGVTFWDPVAGMTGPSAFLGGGGYNGNPAAWQGLANQSWQDAGSSAKTFATQMEDIFKNWGTTGNNTTSGFGGLTGGTSSNSSWGLN